MYRTEGMPISPRPGHVLCLIWLDQTCNYPDKVIMSSKVSNEATVHYPLSPTTLSIKGLYVSEGSKFTVIIKGLELYGIILLLLTLPSETLWRINLFMFITFVLQVLQLINNLRFGPINWCRLWET